VAESGEYILVGQSIELYRGGVARIRNRKIGLSFKTSTALAQTAQGNVELR
jgi:predicted ABC-type transport system involved in lysophospholipase L1 biosynthesis ATPase subunit